MHSTFRTQTWSIANPQDVHYNAKGYALKGQQMARSIESVMRN